MKDFLNSLPDGFKCAFEFRHASWFNDETYRVLKKRNVALCIADTESLTTPVVLTADYGYIRLRNPAYTKDDISRWASVVAEQQAKLQDVYVYFKHEESGVGPKFAKQLLTSLGVRGGRKEAHSQGELWR